MENIDFLDLQSIFSLLAKILSEGLSYEQRVDVLHQIFINENNIPDNAFGFYQMLSKKYSDTNELNFINNLYIKIQATQSFYKDVGADLDSLGSLIKKNKTHIIDNSNASKFNVFTLMPLNENFYPIYESSIRPSLEKLGCIVVQADELSTTEKIIDTIFTQIAKADFLVADITGKNPNVFYELGYAHALGKKVIIILQDEKDVPFDIRGLRYIHYHPNQRHVLSQKIEMFAKNIISEII